MTSERLEKLEVICNNGRIVLAWTIEGKSFMTHESCEQIGWNLTQWRESILIYRRKAWKTKS